MNFKRRRVYALRLFFLFVAKRIDENKTTVKASESSTAVFRYSFLGRGVTLHMRFQSGVMRQMM